MARHTEAMSQSPLYMISDMVSLWQSRRIQDYELLIHHLTAELGERFPESMKNWCGIGERPYPLDFWQVYLVSVNGELAGVTGLYRQPESPSSICWVGWFGLLPHFRGRSVGASVIAELEQVARGFGFKEMRVYTDEINETAIMTYKRAGFTELGVFHRTRGNKSADPDGLVLSVDL